MKFGQYKILYYHLKKKKKIHSIYIVSTFQVVHIGEVLATHGFSSFKFIPGTNDEVIVALKTSEYNGQTATYVMVFTINGKIILGETKVADLKFV